VKSSPTSVSATADDKVVEPKSAEKAEAKTEAKPDEIKTEAVKADAPKADVVKTEPKAAEKAPEKAAEKQTEPAKAEAPATETPARKDVSRLPGLEKPKPELKREGLVAVFISRKDGKLYVRQNFKPVFDVPVTIAPSEKLLGTHVFTAEVDKTDPNL